MVHHAWCMQHDAWHIVHFLFADIYWRCTPFPLSYCYERCIYFFPWIFIMGTATPLPLHNVMSAAPLLSSNTFMAAALPFPPHVSTNAIPPFLLYSYLRCARPHFFYISMRPALPLSSNTFLRLHHICSLIILRVLCPLFLIIILWILRPLFPLILL